MSTPTTETATKPIIVVSSDTHIGPLLKDDLRPYCPQKHLPDYDDYVREFEAYAEAQRRLYPEMYEDDGTGKLVRRARNRLTEGHHDVHALAAGHGLRRDRGRGHLSRQPERRAGSVHHLG